MNYVKYNKNDKSDVQKYGKKYYEIEITVQLSNNRLYQSHAACILLNYQHYNIAH